MDAGGCTLHLMHRYNRWWGGEIGDGEVQRGTSGKVHKQEEQTLRVRVRHLHDSH
jgi:hypothetical protein